MLRKFAPQCLRVGAASAEDRFGARVVEQREKKMLDRDELMAAAPRRDEGVMQYCLELFADHANYRQRRFPESVIGLVQSCSLTVRVGSIAGAGRPQNQSEKPRWP